ncbi:similarity [Geofilum rubicundum JCM 15548]|uniref:Similarity n=1 Tax=Geofilum rubicundum JCM 15548 TaxID=1236989 RepID=A0A0E9LUW3_9BACT|nr:similarity [Geofilum rubicundum JCM 15548]
MAEIITPDAEFCESGEVTIQIKFGEDFDPQFDAWISISHAGGTNTSSFVENYDPSSNDNNYTYSRTLLLDNLTYSYGELIIRIDKAIDGNGTEYTGQDVGGSTTVTLFKTPSSPFTAGDDIATCGLSATLNATPGTESNSYNWEALAGTSLSDANITNPLFTADEDGTYELTFTQTNGACRVSDQVSVALWGQPSATLSTGSEICGTGDAEIDFELQGYGPWEVHYSYGTETGQFTTSDNNPTQIHTLTGETSFQLLSVTDVNDCSTSYTNEPGTMATVVDLLPTANAGNDREVCGKEVTLSAAEPPIGTGTWSGGGSFGNNNDKNSLFEPDPFTGEVSKTLTWTVENKDCAVSDHLVVTFFEQLADGDISAGEDTLLYQQASYILDATPPPFGVGTWTVIAGSGLISQLNDPKAELTQLDFGQTLLRWTVTNGLCEPVWQEVGITVQGLQNPTGFSPNGDGKNDLFIIPGAEFIENNQLIVFNQQGSVVYKTANYQNNWKGTKQNGEVLPEGYYYYVFSGKGVEIKDYLIIKRSIR